VTLFLAIVNFRTGRLTYCNAGHNPPYIARAGGGLDCLKKRHGVVMGAMEGLAYSESTEELGHGETLFVFTDGVTEAMDPAERLYGEERLEQLLAGATGGSDPESVTRDSLEAVEAFANGAEQSDDITILAYQALQPEEAYQRNVLDLAIEAELGRIADVLEAVQAFAEQVDLPTGVGQKLGIILDELLNNSISYGFEDPSGHEIGVHIHTSTHRLTLKVSDDGIPFNPFTLSNPDTSLGIEDRQIGGLGVMLVREMTDSQDYERQSGRNIITLGINLSSNSEN